jgi:lysophospholipase L1-like esterase
MKSSIKVILINLGILLFLLIIIEIFFGGWIFKKNNMNNLNIIHSQTRKHEITDLYDRNPGIVNYSRDQYGLRGTTPDSPEAIDILTVGGSTTDQRYVDDNETWQVVMERKLQKKGFDNTVSNAGIDGQSTFGHIKNFELWFPWIPDLKPKYIVFYIGINDFYLDESQNGLFDSLDSHLSWANSVKDRSAVWNLMRKVKGVYQSSLYEIYSRKIDFKNIEYTRTGLMDPDSYDQITAKRRVSYRRRLQQLVKYSKEMGSTPILVTQPTRKYRIDENKVIYGIATVDKLDGMDFNGVDHYHLLNSMNKEIYAVASEYNLPVIELTNAPIWTDADFYDFNHMDPTGTKKLGMYLAEKMIDILKSNS